MSQALYRKWRPARFDEVVGQEHVTRTLQNSVAAGRIGHAYLLCGPRGTGKTTMARLIAKAANCLHEAREMRPCNVCSICVAVSEGRFLDLIEIDAASNTGVDDIRDLRDKINFSPSEGRIKVYIIDEVHMLSQAAFNALLKTLEEPPAHAMFVLATTEEHKVPATIKSRCQQFNFRLLTDSEIRSRLEWLAEKESLEIEPEAIALITRQGAGSLRDAESLLDQLVAAPGDIVTLERTQLVLGTATDASVSALSAAWLEGDGAAGLDIIHEALASGTDARQFCRQMVVYLRNLLLLQASGSTLSFGGPVELDAVMIEQAGKAQRSTLIAAIRQFNEAALAPANSWQPQLPLELAFIEMLPETAPASGSIETSATEAAAPINDSSRADELQDDAVLKQQAVTAPPKPSAEMVDPPPADAPPDEVEPVVSDKSSAGQTVSMALIRAHWPDLVNRIGQKNKNLPALLNMGKPLAVEGNTVVLGFDYPIFKEKFDNTTGAAQLVGQTLGEILSAKCMARSVVSSEYPVLISKEEFQALAQELGGVVREE